jgi:D-alanyl-D-alanine carboxypeptidase (penicillin-binding protein 5/6)
MSGSSVLSGGQRRRRPRRRPPRHRRASPRRRRRGTGLRIVALAVALGAVAVIVIIVVGLLSGSDHRAPPAHGSASTSAAVHPRPAGGTLTPPGPTVPAAYGVAPARAAERVTIHLRAALRSGLLFDVDSGQVLWDREPDLELPIASLTKMMTALIVAVTDRPNARVLITRTAVDFSGSGVGLLPLHKRVPLKPLLYGLLLPSGNDAAIALAQHVAGTQDRFITMMNARAHAMGLGCTHFTTVSGIVDAGNHSCATDLAKLARAMLDERLLARIVGSASAVLKFPIKHGKLYLYNNNPLYRLGYPGTDGVKTGYTTAAGVCLVATARRGRSWLGVVLLHSADEIDQAPELLNAGFAAMRRGGALTSG